MGIDPQVKLVLEKYPKLTIDPGANTLTGSIRVDSEDYYDISIDLSPYPEYFPVVFETGERIPKKIDRHVYTDTGSCCFTTNAKTQILLKTVITSLMDFMKEIVVPYFMNNSYYEINGRYYDEEYSHGPVGVVEGYRDILQISDDLRIAKVMFDYLNGGKLDVHQNCYCGSGKSLLRCRNGIHDKCYRNFRKVSQEQIQLDLYAHFHVYLRQKGVIQ
jgi:hypothetical protein